MNFYRNQDVLWEEEGEEGERRFTQNMTFQRTYSSGTFFKLFDFDSATF